MSSLSHVHSIIHHYARTHHSTSAQITLTPLSRHVRYSDNYYRAALIEALGESVTPVVSPITDGTITPDSLSPETRQLLDEIVRALNLDKLLPCYKFVVTQACLRALRRLQRCGHLASRPQLFKGYAAYGQFIGE